MNKTLQAFFILSILLLHACADNEAIRGRLTLSLTDAPSDADNIKEVNLSITSIDVLTEGSESWQTIKSFEDPITVDLLEYTQGDSYDLTEQYLTPGNYKGLRLQLSIANVDNGLTVFPQSNLVFTNGTQETLFVENGGTDFIEVRSPFSIATNQTTFLTLDFDVRKSIIITNQGYRLRPSMRMVDDQSAGAIDGQFRDFADYDKVVVYAYETGDFTPGETNGTPSFANSISAARVQNSKGGTFTIAFLPGGSYDLIFVELKDDGSTNAVLGKLASIIVESQKDTFSCAQLTPPDVQGNCRQIEEAL